MIYDKIITELELINLKNKIIYVHPNDIEHVLESIDKAGGIIVYKTSDTIGGITINYPCIVCKINEVSLTVVVVNNTMTEKHNLLCIRSLE